MVAAEHGLLTSTPDRVVEARRSARSSTAPWRLVGAAGVAFALLGLTDVLLLWYPLRIGRPDWEFATVSGSFDALPLATIGALLIVARLHAAGSRLSRRLVGSGLILLVLTLCAAFVLFALSFATGIGQVNDETRWILIRAGTKTSVAACVYVILYILMALSLFRAARKDHAV